MRSVHSEEVGREDSAPKSNLVAMPTPLTRRKAASGSDRYSEVVLGSPESLARGMLPQGLPRNPRELAISSRNAVMGGNGVPEGRPKGARKDGGAVLRPHSTGEGGEPQGSARGGHGTHWREGGNKRTHLSKGDITGTQNLDSYVYRHRQNI